MKIKNNKELKALYRLKEFCNSENGYPYNRYSQSSTQRNLDLEIIEKALNKYTKMKKNEEKEKRIRKYCEEMLKKGKNKNEIK